MTLLTDAVLTDAVLTVDAARRLAERAGTVPRPRTVLLQLLQAGDDPLEIARIVATDPSTVALLPQYLAAASLESLGAALLDPAVERRLAAVAASVRPAAR